ncbi:MAG: prepilin peptidase [Clostridiales bacterium]|nr:prepilin peptidase [Clostridiales bacterium]
MNIYREIQMISLTSIAVVAVLCDLQSGRIPNAVTATGLMMGLTYQLFENEILGVILYLGGIMLPVLLLGGLYYFRMLGAGDIKLLSVVGGFLGPAGVLSCMVRSFFVAAVFSLVILYRNHLFGKQFTYFWAYISDYAKNGQWHSYTDGVDERAKFCFSIPVLIGILCCV